MKLKIKCTLTLSTNERNGGSLEVNALVNQVPQLQELDWQNISLPATSKICSALFISGKWYCILCFDQLKFAPTIWVCLICGLIQFRGIFWGCTLYTEVSCRLEFTVTAKCLLTFPSHLFSLCVNNHKVPYYPSVIFEHALTFPTFPSYFSVLKPFNSIWVLTDLSTLLQHPSTSPSYFRVHWPLHPISASTDLSILFQCPLTFPSCLFQPWDAWEQRGPTLH